MEISKDNSWDMWEEKEVPNADFSKITRKIKAYWPYCILCALILTVGALFYLYMTNSYYNVKASILIQDNNKKGTGSGGLISSLQDVGLIGSSDNVYNEQTIITSYPLVENVVNDLQLFLQFSVKENIRELPLYKANLPFKADVINYNLESTSTPDEQLNSFTINLGDSNGYTIISGDKTWKGSWGLPLQLSFGTIVFRENSLTAKWPTDKPINFTALPASEIADKLTANLTANIPNNQTNIINLTLQTTTPQLGVDVLNALVSSYQSSTVNDNNKLNDSTLKFINQRLVIVGKDLDSIETQIQIFKQKNQLANLPKQSDVLVDNLSQQDRELNSQMVQLSMINSLIEFLDENQENPRVIPASLVINDNTLTQTIDNYNRLLSTKERLGLSVTEKNPIFQNIEQQLAGLQKSIRSGLGTVRQTLTTGIDKMKQRNSSLAGMIHEVPPVEKEFGNYARQQAIKKDLYLFLLQKKEESLLAKSSTLANSRIIAPARASKKPIKPKRGLILLSSVLAGLLLPLGYDRISSLFNTKIRTKEDITALTDIPIIGEIGYKKEEDPLIVAGNVRSVVAEQFRTLRTNLQFLLTQKNNKVIMVTSLASGEGKTFISANLSAIFGLTEKKIVLLEMDLRKPKIMSSLNLRSKKGFTHYVIGKAEIDEIIVPSKFDPNVSIIAAGIIPPNPVELILNKRTDDLFNYLRTKFDLIIIDTAPNIVSEPQLLAKYADLSLFIVRINHTQKEVLKQIKNENSMSKLPRLNMVVNGIKAKRYGGHYYSYGHFDYGYYYHEKDNGLRASVRESLKIKI